MEMIFTWEVFGKLLLGLFTLYWALIFISKIVLKFSKKTKTKRLIQKVSLRIFTLYKPIAVVLLLVTFISVNYIVHGILFLIIGVFMFSYIRNYLSGIMFKVNRLVNTGMHLISGEYKGEVIELASFGAILKIPKGKHFINYSEILRNGFSVTQTEDDTLFKTLYIDSEINGKALLDLLFDTPLINFIKPPTLKNVPENSNQRLQFTLEKGAKLEDVIALLKQNKIETTTKNNTI